MGMFFFLSGDHGVRTEANLGIELLRRIKIIDRKIVVTNGVMK